MASKRPSYVSIRARQRNIIEGIGTRNLRYKDAAKEFGVTRQELKRFLETKPQTLRKSYNRSPSLRKLYVEGERPETRRVLGVKRIRHYEFREHVLRPMEKDLTKVSDLQTGRLIQRLYYINNIDTQNWAAYTREANLPASIDTIRLLHRNGKITDATYRAALREWAKTYGIKASRVAEYEIEEE